MTGKAARAAQICSVNPSHALAGRGYDYPELTGDTAHTDTLGAVFFHLGPLFECVVLADLELTEICRPLLPECRALGF